MPRMVQPMSPVTITWSFLKPAWRTACVDGHEGAAMRAAGADGDGAGGRDFFGLRAALEEVRRDVRSRAAARPCTTWRTPYSPMRSKGPPSLPTIPVGAQAAGLHAAGRSRCSGSSSSRTRMCAQCAAARGPGRRERVHGVHAQHGDGLAVEPVARGNVEALVEIGSRDARYHHAHTAAWPAVMRRRQIERVQPVLGDPSRRRCSRRAIRSRCWAMQMAAPALVNRSMS